MNILWFGEVHKNFRIIQRQGFYFRHIPITYFLQRVMANNQTQAYFIYFFCTFCIAFWKLHIVLSNVLNGDESTTLLLVAESISTHKHAVELCKRRMFQFCRVVCAQNPCGPANDLQKHSTDGTAHPPIQYCCSLYTTHLDIKHQKKRSHEMLIVYYKKERIH